MSEETLETKTEITTDVKNDETLTSNMNGNNTTSNMDQKPIVQLIKELETKVDEYGNLFWKDFHTICLQHNIDVTTINQFWSALGGALQSNSKIDIKTLKKVALTNALPNNNTPSQRRTRERSKSLTGNQLKQFFNMHPINGGNGTVNDCTNLNGNISNASDEKMNNKTRDDKRMRQRANTYDTNNFNHVLNQLLSLKNNVKAYFQQYDLKGDGSLHRSEFGTLIAYLFNVSEHDISTTFQLISQNNSFYYLNRIHQLQNELHKVNMIPDGNYFLNLLIRVYTQPTTFDDQKEFVSVMNNNGNSSSNSNSNSNYNANQTYNNGYQNNAYNQNNYIQSGVMYSAPNAPMNSNNYLPNTMEDQSINFAYNIKKQIDTIISNSTSNNAFNLLSYAAQELWKWVSEYGIASIKLMAQYKIENSKLQLSQGTLVNQLRMVNQKEVQYQETIKEYEKKIIQQENALNTYQIECQNLKRTAQENMSLIGQYRNQADKYCAGFETLNGKHHELQSKYTKLNLEHSQLTSDNNEYRQLIEIINKKHNLKIENIKTEYQNELKKQELIANKSNNNDNNIDDAIVINDTASDTNNNNNDSNNIDNINGNNIDIKKDRKQSIDDSTNMSVNEIPIHTLLETRKSSEIASIDGSTNIAKDIEFCNDINNISSINGLNNNTFIDNNFEQNIIKKMDYYHDQTNISLNNIKKKCNNNNEIKNIKKLLSSLNRKLDNISEQNVINGKTIFEYFTKNNNNNNNNRNNNYYNNKMPTDMITNTVLPF